MKRLTDEQILAARVFVGDGPQTRLDRIAFARAVEAAVLRLNGFDEGGVHEAEKVCAEAYQVVGSLLSDLGKFETPEAKKILDNLSAGKLVHKDVLPWLSYEKPRATGCPDTMQESFASVGANGETLAKTEQSLRINLQQWDQQQVSRAIGCPDMMDEMAQLAVDDKVKREEKSPLATGPAG